MSRKEYRVTLNNLSRDFTTFADAIQFWTAASWELTYRLHLRVTSGCISLREYVDTGDDVVCVRDADLIHLEENGHLYLNSTLTHS